MASGSAGPCQVGRGPRCGGPRDLSSMSGVLADTAYRRPGLTSGAG